jgi:hypothetical protein
VERAGLDDQKLSLLAKWADGLRRDPRPEVAAAGRAIEMLIDEVERLNVLIWDRRLNTESESREDVVEAPWPVEPDLMQPLGVRLRRQARRALHRPLRSE